MPHIIILGKTETIRTKLTQIESNLESLHDQCHAEGLSFEQAEALEAQINAHGEPLDEIIGMLDGLL